MSIKTCRTGLSALTSPRKIRHTFLYGNYVNCMLFQKQDGKDSSIHKRLSWNCGGPGGDSAPSYRPIAATPGLSADSVHSSSGVSSTGESVGSGLNLESDG